MIPYSCTQDVVSGVKQLLQHVTSIKAISSIRSAVHSLLATPMSGGGACGDLKAAGGGVDEGQEEVRATQWPQQWSQVCQLILNKELNIWDTFLREVFLDRVKVRDC